MILDYKTPESVTNEALNEALRKATLGVALSGEGGKDLTPKYYRREKKQDVFQFLNLILEQTANRAKFFARDSEMHRAIIKEFSTLPNFRNFADNPGAHYDGQFQAMVDLPLTDVSNGYFNDMYIAEAILTPLSVMRQTGTIWEYGEEHLEDHNPNDFLADGIGEVKSADTNSRKVQAMYNIATYGLKSQLDVNEYKNVMLPFDAEADLTRAITQILMLMCEIDLATKIMTASDYSASTNQAIASGSEVDVKPRERGVVETAVTKLRTAVRNACGHWPNTMVCDSDVIEKLIRHDDVRGQIWQDLTTSRLASIAEVKKVFQVDRLFIGKALKASSGSGLTPVWGKNIFLGYIDPMRALRQRTLGYFGHYNTMSGFTIKTQSRGNPINTEFFQYRNWQHLITNRSCGGMITNVIS